MTVGERVAFPVNRPGRLDVEPATGTTGAGTGDDRPLAADRVDPDFSQAG